MPSDEKAVDDVLVSPVDARLVPSIMLAGKPSGKGLLSSASASIEPPGNKGFVGRFKSAFSDDI